MGLLTDPNAGQGKFVKILLKYYIRLCILMYISGIAWFCALAYPPMNASTYFSENALLPGLVKSQFHEDRFALIYHDELLDEMKKYENAIPYPWLLAKFKQIGLDAYTHNFTLNSPFNRKERFSGKNVYGILRASRASSTEALVLSVPFRSPTSVHPKTAASVAIMLAFAKYVNKKKYWAKDIIFLITEHEQLGIQAWLEAYYGMSCGSENILDHGDLKGRAGAIQAAINLELHSTKIGQIDLKIEGLNGQLPNLDLFNLVSKMCSKEGVYYTFKNKGPEYHRDPVKEWQYYFKNLLAMVATQATGIPNGNHGLFHRFGIQALTIEGFEQSNARGSSKVGLLSIGRIIEGIFRSLNNLLERFHQSFFFYLLPSSDRYISIGLYMPAICLIAGALFIKSCAKWFKMQENVQDTVENSVLKERKEQKIDRTLFIFLLSHFYGILLMNMPHYLATYGEQYIYNMRTWIFYVFLVMSAISLLLPFMISFRTCKRSLDVLNIFCLLEMGTVWICISMNNFSLGIFCAVVSVPLALLVNTTFQRYYSYLQRLLWLMVHPLVILLSVIYLNSYLMFPDEKLKDILYKAVDATQQAIVYSIIDSMIYGNWLFSVVTCIFIPNWLCYWFVACSNLKNPRNSLNANKKIN